MRLMIDYVRKYRYNQPTLAPLVLSIVRIVLNTLESQYHRCYGGIGATLSHGHPSTSQHTSSLGALRTREQSQASFDGDNNPLETPDVKGISKSNYHKNEIKF